MTEALIALAIFIPWGVIGFFAGGIIAGIYKKLNKTNEEEQ